MKWPDSGPSGGLLALRYRNETQLLFEFEKVAQFEVLGRLGDRGRCVVGQLVMERCPGVCLSVW